LVTAFFARGGGRGAGIKYLTEEREPAAKVLRGDIEQTIQLIDSLEFKQRYCSGVHRFTEADLSDQTKHEIMDSFENVIFAGMEPEQRPPVLWVQHREKGGTELHFIIPEVEMTTGKKFTPYFHKTDLDLVDSWKNVVNHDYELSDPNSPERRQTLTLPKNLPQTKKQAVQLVNNEITGMVEQGFIKNRDEVIETLENAGFQVTRQAKNFISIQAEDWKQPARLKGDWYVEHFTSVDELTKNQIRERGKFQLRAEERFRGDSERLQRAIEKRTAKHVQRYKLAEKDAGEPERADTNLSVALSRIEDELNHSFDDTQLDSESERLSLVAGERSPESERAGPGLEEGSPEMGAESASVLQPEPGPGEENQGLGIHEQDELQAGSRPEYSDQTGQPLEAEGADLGSGTPETGKTIKETLERWFETIKTGVKEGYDRVRTALNEWFGVVKQAVQDGHGALGRADRELDREQHQTGQTSRDVGRVIRAEQKLATRLQQKERGINEQVNRGIERVIENRTDELEQFKLEINLAGYASKQGYALVKNESSRNSYVMKHNNGDKIVVATAADGHGIYFSVRDSSDNGSIIDFVQKRQGLNLGQVRKELRQELGTATPTAMQTIKSKPRPSSQNIERVIQSFMAMKPVTDHPYLVNERKIPKPLLKEPRFNSIRIDRKGNAVFPHYDENGLSGYELKNSDFTGFSRGGKKSLWRTGNLENAPEIVLTESGIDALSHAALNPKRKAAYISLGGQISHEQYALLGNVLKQHQERGAKITLALDNDEKGKEMTKDLSQKLGIEWAEVPKAKDWNEQLQEQVQKTQSRGFELGR
jgi:hypothetical protein